MQDEEETTEGATEEPTAPADEPEEEQPDVPADPEPVPEEEVAEAQGDGDPGAVGPFNAPVLTSPSPKARSFSEHQAAKQSALRAQRNG